VDADDSLNDERRWARRITLLSVAAMVVLGTPNLLNAIAHSRVDSEVGVMMYGLPLFIGLLYTCPVIGAFILVWGVGLRKARRRGEVIPRREFWCFGVIAVVIGFLLLMFSGTYLRMIGIL
jgi:hypothetical protein